MSDNVLHDYTTARVAVDSARQAVVSLVAKATANATKLKNWETVRADTGSGGYPMDVPLIPDLTISPVEWPTIDQLHTLLVAFHAARREADRLWRLIPSQQQPGLVPPPKYPK